MKNIVKFILYFYFIPYMSFSQGVNNLWLMGGGYTGSPPPYVPANMDFTSGVLNISIDTNRTMDFDETNGEICDKNGNLLFYSNGIFIANAANDTMINGDSLNPSSFTTEWANANLGLTIPQANLVIPFSADSNKYYLFHGTIDDYPGTYCAFYLYYSIIDMSGDSSRGIVIEKNHILLNDNLVPGRLTACKHANGRDWWIITHQYNTNLYYKYLVTPSGIQGT